MIVNFGLFTLIGCIFLGYWFFWFFGFLFGFKTETRVSEYFQIIFKSYRSSRLRIGWSSFLFAFLYVILLLVSIFTKSAYYPAKWLRTLLSFIFFTKENKEK